MLRLLPRQPRTPRLPISHYPATRPLTTTTPLRLKEDADRSPSQLEQAKQDSLKKNEWSRDTASKSEEVVGADQEKVKDHGKHMEELQKETARESEREKGK